MKRAQEARSDPSPGQKGNMKRKASTSKGSSTKSESSNDDETTSVANKGASNDVNHKKEDNDDEDNFEGDYFRDFYYNQGDYRNEAQEEVKEKIHAIEIEEHEQEIKQKSDK